MVVDPLQEDWILPFTVRGIRLSLDRDHWSGLTILALSAPGDDIVLEIKGALASSPPSRRPAGDDRTVVSSAFLQWLVREPGAADLRYWR